MASKPDTYPSPSAGQPGAAVHPYQQQSQDPSHDTLDLGAQLHTTPQHNDTNPASIHMGSGAGLASAVTQHLNQEGGYYAQPPQASTPQPYQGQIPGISGPMPAATTTTEESARKKTKVTRACDECRRKKIKCDAESDGPAAPRCSNCQRTNAECKFSRAPQKRGPSKGYIKELSDRVAQLERGGFDLDAVSPIPAAGERKRTYSTAEGGGGGAIYDSPAPEKYKTNPTKTFAPIPVPEAQMAADSQQSNNASARVESLGIELATPETYQSQTLRPLHQVEGHHLEIFLNKVNRSFPLFGSRDGINSNLQYCPPPLRQAFYYSVGSVVGTIEHTTGEQTRSQCANCVYNMLNTAAPPGPLSERMFPPESRTWQGNLVYLQVLLLLVLHQESSGQMHEDPFGAFTKDQLLQQARRLVDYLQLRHVTEIGHLGSTSSEASRIFSSARRAYWIFVVLDIWQSLAGRSFRNLPYMSIDAELSPQDRSVLGDEFYHLVRHSSVAAMMADQLKGVRVQSPMITQMGYWMHSMQRPHSSGGSESSSSSTPNMHNAPMAVIASLTSDLFCAFLTAGPTPCPPTQAIVSTACSLAAHLAACDRVPEGTPLMHHFVVVAAKALVDAWRYPPQRAAARAGLQNVLAAVRSKGLLDTSHWREPIVTAVMERLDDVKNDVLAEVGGEGIPTSASLAVPPPPAPSANTANGNSSNTNGDADAGSATNGNVDGIATTTTNGNSAAPTAEENDDWKTNWPLLVWEGYLRTPV